MASNNEPSDGENCAVFYIGGRSVDIGMQKGSIYRRELQPLLRHEDRIGMWFSIEHRVPFLDHVLVELIGRLSPKFLIHAGYLKYPLRIMFPGIPEKLRFNVSKKGFWENYSQVPDLKGLLHSMLNNHASLMAMVSDNKRIEGLSRMALWRFFQIALLWEAGTREEVRHFRS